MGTKKKEKITNKMQREGLFIGDPFALNLRDLAVLERELISMPKQQIMQELKLTDAMYDQVRAKARYKAKIEELKQERLKNIEQIMSDEAYLATHAREAIIRNVHLMRNGKSENTQQKSIFDILTRSKIGTPTVSNEGVKVGVQIIFSNELSKGDPDLIQVLTRLTEKSDE